MEFNDMYKNIDERKLRRLKTSIYLLERENLKKNPPNSNIEMIERIRKLIEEEIKKCY